MGTGFGEGGVCTPGGCPKKFWRRRHRGGGNFFSGGNFVSRPGGHFAKNCKIGGPFGTPGCTPSLPSAGGCVG